MIPRAALVARSSALAIREMPYVDAARAAGFSHRRIILRHMLPNVMAPYLIMLTAYLGQAILLEASLDRKSTRLNSSHSQISYAVFCLKKKKESDSALRDTNSS